MTKGFAPAAWAMLGAAVMALAFAVSGVVHLGSDADGDGDEEARGSSQGALTEGGLVELNTAQLAHAAIRTQPLVAGSVPSLRRGFARAMDLSGLAAIDADLAAARGALAASRAEAKRLSSLADQDQSASLQAVEAARAKADSDAAQLNLAQRRIGLEFGPGLARMKAADRGMLIADVGAGRAALLRIDIPGQPLEPGAKVSISDGERRQSMRILGPAAAVDPQLQNAAMLAVLRAPMAAVAMAGRQFAATAAGSDLEDGVIVPRSALVRWQGRLWAYREVRKGAFQPVPIDGARPVDGGWLVNHGLTAGERIVTDGATTLFAVEWGGTATQEDD